MANLPVEKIEDRTYFLKSNPALFEATLDCFSSRSFESASLNDILRASGVNKGSFYYRFPDKRTLYFALLDDLFVRQNILFDGQTKAVLGLRTLRGMTDAVFRNVLLLDREDPRLTDLQKRAFGESPAFVKEFRGECVSSLHDRFVSYAAGLSKNGFSSGRSYPAGFLGVLHLHLKEVLGDGFTEIGIGALVDSLFSENSGKTGEPGNETPVSGLLEMLSKGKPGPVDASGTGSLGIRAGEVFALVGGSRSRTTVLDRILSESGSDRGGDPARWSGNPASTGNSDADSGAFQTLFSLSGRSTPRQILRQAAKRGKNFFDPDVLLRDFSLLSEADRRVSSLTEEKRHKVDLLRTVAGVPEMFVAEDPCGESGQADCGEICNLLLKCRDAGSKIILSTSAMRVAMAVADRIAFLSEGRVLAVESLQDLRKKYQGKWIVLEYREGNLDHRAAFPESGFSSSEFRELLTTKKLLSVRTKDGLDEEIFQMETGVEME